VACASASLLVAPLLLIQLVQALMQLVRQLVRLPLEWSG
jgi:hypothetical protein